MKQVEDSNIPKMSEEELRQNTIDSQPSVSRDYMFHTIARRSKTPPAAGRRADSCPTKSKIVDRILKKLDRQAHCQRLST